MAAVVASLLAADFSYLLPCDVMCVRGEGRAVPELLRQS
jgi:hypothetical protein